MANNIVNKSAARTKAGLEKAIDVFLDNGINATAFSKADADNLAGIGGNITTLFAAKAPINAPVFTGQVTTPKVMFTPEGGIAIKLTNKTGVASIKGAVVSASAGTDNAFGTNPTSGDMPFGVIYEAGVADASECWVVVAGIAEVLLVDSTATTRGYIAYSSTTGNGRIDTAAVIPAAAVHFTEIGHTIESKGGGTDVLVKCVLHFN